MTNTTNEPKDAGAGSLKVEQRDIDRTNSFLANWPRVSVPSYMAAALAESMRDHRLSAARAAERRNREITQLRSALVAPSDTKGEGE